MRMVSGSWAAVLALGLLSGGCEQAITPAPTAAGPTVYRHALDQAATSIDPAQAASLYQQYLVVNLYDTLYRYAVLARPTQVRPNLAIGPPEVSADGLRYTIRLRSDAHFADHPAFANGRGPPVSAEDVVYSFKRMFVPATKAVGAYLWQRTLVGVDEFVAAGVGTAAPLRGVRALDAQTVEFTLKEPYPQFIYTLASPYAAILPAAIGDAIGDDLGTVAVGSGPYVLRSLDGAGAVLERNPTYRQDLFDPHAEGFDGAVHDPRWLQLAGRPMPFIDRIELKFMVDGIARYNALAAGEVDYIEVAAAALPRVVASTSPLVLNDAWADKVEHRLLQESGFVYIDFNHAHPQLGRGSDATEGARNRALRCALRRAFDWSARNRAFYNDLGVVFPGVLGNLSPEHDPAHAHAPADPVAARALLETAGWTMDALPTLRYGTVNDTAERQRFEQFRGFMVAIGYPAEKLELAAAPTFGDFVQAINDGQLDLISIGWALDLPDAISAFQLYYGPNRAPGPNAAQYANPAYDRLYEAARVLPPSPERTALYRQMNRILVDDCVMIGSLARNRLSLWNKALLAYPDRDIVGGWFLRAVAAAPVD